MRLSTIERLSASPPVCWSKDPVPSLSRTWRIPLRSPTHRKNTSIPRPDSLRTRLRMPWQVVCSARRPPAIVPAIVKQPVFTNPAYLLAACCAAMSTVAVLGARVNIYGGLDPASTAAHQAEVLAAGQQLDGLKVTGSTAVGGDGPIIIGPAQVAPALVLVGDVSGSMQQLWGAYCVVLDAHPLSTKIVTGLVGTVLGDMIAQWLDRRRKVKAAAALGSTNVPSLLALYDWPRLVRLLVYSAIIGTPLAHYWYAFLDQTISPTNPTAFTTVATKVLLDQGLLAPIATAIFLTVQKLLEGRPSAVLSSLRHSWADILKINYLLWPAANFISFWLVPSEQRVLYMYAVSLPWTAVLSHMANRQPTPPSKAKQ